ncbi:decapping and exoribonuclease protein-like [Musca vetustissima]|uniref:decapping and exoribonuclease protein-like n=1 Tax=Musca vetustissima TaxID=27455 RepID=UPI002AB64009|nr:decapping and exoribonuclease protein-like [Musca vetustissima]
MSRFLNITAADMQKFQQQPEYMTKPKLVQIYDINYTRFTPAKKIRYLFKEPSPSEYPLDLESNYEVPIELKHDTQTNLLHPLLHCYFGKDRNDRVHCKGDDGQRHENNPEMTDVYTRRGILEKIMEFCYGKYNFCVLVSRYKGKIFMVEKPKDEDKFDEQQHGHKHHRRITQLTSIDISPELCNRNDDNVFQIAIHEANLGKYNLHYVGRAQSIKITEECRNDLNQLNKVEFISTKQVWSNMRDKSLKLLKYWLQTYLSNVRELYIAYKDTNAMVRDPIECRKTCDIPKSCFWEPSVCITFLNEFLTKVEEVTSNTDSWDTVFEFHFGALNKQVVLITKSGNAFIPKEYIDYIQ